jgi:hypothetical protein
MKKKMKKLQFLFPVLGLFVFAGFFCSCVGLKTEITLKADGTGTLLMEYRISREFMDIGALDGNARWPSVPVGRADFERSIGRMEGLKLISFSATEDNSDLLYKASVGFSKLEDILPLLDHSGEAASLIRGEKRQSLVLTLGRENETETISPDLLAMVEEAFRAYLFTVSLSAPSQVEIRVEGGEASRLERDGNKAGFSIPVYELISRNKPMTVEFVF